MTELKGASFALIPIFLVTAPALVLLTGCLLFASAIGRPLFGTDPAAAVAEEHPAGWAILKLTGGWALCLLLGAALLERAI